jgi:hypothetical protein
MELGVRLVDQAPAAKLVTGVSAALVDPPPGRVVADQALGRASGRPRVACMR